MAGSSPGVSPWNGKRHRGISENGSINPSDMESVDDEDVMLSSRAHKDVLENMLSVRAFLFAEGLKRKASMEGSTELHLYVVY